MTLSVPTTRSDVRLVGRTVRLVLSIPVYAALAVLVCLGTLTAIVVSQNGSLVADLVIGGSLPLSNRLTVFTQQYPFVGPGFTTAAGLAVLVVSGLTGTNVSLVTYHLREHDLSASGGGASAVGMALGVLGAGCAACGSALVVGVLSLAGASGLVLLLPFEGLEVSFLAIVALALSTYWIAQGLRGDSVRGCPVDP